MPRIRPISDSGICGPDSPALLWLCRISLQTGLRGMDRALQMLRQWRGLRALEPVWASTWCIMSSHLTDGDTEAQGSDVNPGILGVLEVSHLCPLPLSTQKQQAVSNIVQLHTDLQHRHTKPSGGLGSTWVLAVVLQGLYRGLEGSHKGHRVVTQGRGLRGLGLGLEMGVGAAPAPGHCPHPPKLLCFGVQIPPHTPGAHHIRPQGFGLDEGGQEGCDRFRFLLLRALLSGSSGPLPARGLLQA